MIRTKGLGSLVIFWLVGCGGPTPEPTKPAPTPAPEPTAAPTADTTPSSPSETTSSKLKVSIPPDQEGRRNIAHAHEFCVVGDNLRLFDCMAEADKHVKAGSAEEVGKGLAIYWHLCVDHSMTPACYDAMRVFTKSVAAWDAALYFPLALGGCAFGAEDTCVENGDRFRDGKDVEKNADRATKLYKKGCEELSHKPSCERMK